MSTQVKRRRGTASENASFTGALGEIVAITDTKRLALHDGATAGGKEFPNSSDMQTMEFIVGTVGGTADAITLTVTPAITAYANKQRFMFKATGTNTGAVTVAISGLGTKAIQMVKLGALAALVAGDIISGVWYEIIYDGTQFQLQTSGEGVSQASTSEISSQSAVTKYISPDRLRYAPCVAKYFGYISWSSSGSIFYTLNGTAFNISSVGSTGGSSGFRANFTNALNSSTYVAGYTLESGSHNGISRTTTRVDYTSAATNGVTNFWGFEA